MQQCITTQSPVQQYITIQCSEQQYITIQCLVQQCITKQCSVQQCITIQCSVQQCITKPCSVQQCITIQCSLQQCSVQHNHTVQLGTCVSLTVSLCCEHDFYMDTSLQSLSPPPPPPPVCPFHLLFNIPILCHPSPHTHTHFSTQGCCSLCPLLTHTAIISLNSLTSHSRHATPKTLSNLNLRPFC